MLTRSGETLVTTQKTKPAGIRRASQSSEVDWNGDQPSMSSAIRRSVSGDLLLRIENQMKPTTI